MKPAKRKPGRDHWPSNYSTSGISIKRRGHMLKSNPHDRWTIAFKTGSPVQFVMEPIQDSTEWRIAFARSLSQALLHWIEENQP